jgi:hypothetical protein
VAFKYDSALNYEPTIPYKFLGHDEKYYYIISFNNDDTSCKFIKLKIEKCKISKINDKPLPDESKILKTYSFNTNSVGICLRDDTNTKGNLMYEINEINTTNLEYSDDFMKKNVTIGNVFKPKRINRQRYIRKYTEKNVIVPPKRISDSIGY